MNLVFMGTPEFAVPTLEALAGAHRLRGVCTQPDRPAGRGARVTAPPVKRAALALGLPVRQPEKIRAPEELDWLKALAPEALVIVGYGKIIPPSILELPRYGCINLHASLLPKYRGAAPVNWAILRGETLTGVTTMRIDAGLDTGDLLLSRETEIAPEEDAVSLSRRLAEMGAPLMLETLRGLESGALTAVPQDHSRATPAPMLKKEDGRIDWRLPAQEIANRVRGLVPWPGAFTTLRGSLLHVWKARPNAECGVRNAECRSLEAGTVLVDGARLFVLCGDASVLELLEVQLEGRRRLLAADFLNGARLASGELLC